jgi:hypothetical protein
MTRALVAQSRAWNCFSRNSNGSSAVFDAHAALEDCGLEVCYASQRKMSNPDNYAIIKSSGKESGVAGTTTRLHIRKRGASNWALPVPEASFDSEDKQWEDALAQTVKRSGESVQFSAKDLERLRAEANRILHPVTKTRDYS